MKSQSSKGDGWKNPRPTAIRNIINESRTIAIIGLSSKTEKPSHRVGRYLKKQGFDIIPVNPKEKEILGQKSYPDITSIGRKIDIVDVFRKGEDTPPIVREAIKCGVGCIWLQEGIESQESYDLAQEAGIPIVMNTCLLKAHKKTKA